MHITWFCAIILYATDCFNRQSHTIAECFTGLHLRGESRGGINPPPPLEFQQLKVLWNGSRTIHLLFWIPDLVLKAQTWLVNSTTSRTRDQAILIAPISLAAILTATYSRWSLSLRDGDAVCTAGSCYGSSCNHTYSGLVVANLILRRNKRNAMRALHGF